MGRVMFPFILVIRATSLPPDKTDGNSLHFLSNTNLFAVGQNNCFPDIQTRQHICKCELEINTEMIKYFQWKMMSGINLMQ